MENREALTIFRTIQKCRHQALHTNDCGNCERCQYYLEHEQIDGAVALAISALEKQEQDRWRPFRCRKTTEDDCSSFDYIMDCELPEDGQRILITVNNNGHEPVQMDTFFSVGGEECALDSGYDLCDEAIAWRPLPEPYTEEEA